MFVPGQTTEHYLGVGQIDRLSQHLSAQMNERVASRMSASGWEERQDLAFACGNSTACSSADRVRPYLFDEGRGDDLKGQSQKRQ